MQNENAKTLNQILRGEHMAIDVYNTYISSLPPGDLRSELSRIKHDHERHARELTACVKNTGSKPVEAGGAVSNMAELMGKIKTLVHPDPRDILQQLYDGEDKGLARAVQFAEHRLGQKEKQLLDEIFSDEHDHLKKLRQLMSEHGHKIEQ